MSSLSESKEICRICHCEGEEGNKLISACLCLGSLRFVHLRCLQKWIKSSEKVSCELCRFEYIMTTKTKPFTEVRCVCVCGVCTLCVCVCVHACTCVSNGCSRSFQYSSLIISGHGPILKTPYNQFTYWMYILFSALTSTVTILFKAGFKGMYNALIFSLVTADLSFGAFPFPVPSDSKQVILMWRYRFQSIVRAGVT